MFAFKQKTTFLIQQTTKVILFLMHCTTLSSDILVFPDVRAQKALESTLKSYISENPLMHQQLKPETAWKCKVSQSDKADFHIVNTLIKINGC